MYKYVMVATPLWARGLEFKYMLGWQIIEESQKKHVHVSICMQIHKSILIMSAYPDFTNQ